MAKLQDDNGEFLRKIYQPEEVNMDNIPPYVPPSEDKLLSDFAKSKEIIFFSNFRGRHKIYCIYLHCVIRTQLTLLPIRIV